MINSLSKERRDFSEDEGEVILSQAARYILAALQKEPIPEFKSYLAEVPVVGVFVSLKRGDTLLRACCGSINETGPSQLGMLLEAAATRAALRDERFPSIHIDEFPLLDLEVSVMHDLRTLDQDPNLRLHDITIGQHGLIISHAKGRGLLLPQVASEKSWDKPTFFQQVCLKAGLPNNTWLKPEAEIKRFSASIFHREAETTEADFRDLDDNIRTLAVEYTTQIVAGEDAKSPAELNISVPSSGWGLLVQTSDLKTAVAFQNQGSLANMIKSATDQLNLDKKGKPVTLKEFLVFGYLVKLSPKDYPKRLAGILPGQCVIGSLDDKTSVVVRKGPKDPVQQVLRQMVKSPSKWEKSGLLLNSGIVESWIDKKNSENKLPVSPSVTAETIDGTRLPSAAGTFYPDNAYDIKLELDRYFSNNNVEQKFPVRAVLLPHAGWKYCGDIIAETLGQAEIPDTVVIVGPKHTHIGARWSVSNAKRWQIPGAEVPIEEESAAYIASAVPGMQKEELAHQKEHGSEVIVPFLHYLNPNVKIVPIALGAGTFDDFVALGKSFSAFRKRLQDDGEKCLFIISSDLNHFADDRTNRELDQKILDIFVTADSKKLFDTCTREDISMCGLRPAVAVLNSLDLDFKRHHPDISIIRYETSARVSNDPTKVVGYAGALIG